jgi:hypothetical protein
LLRPGLLLSDESLGVTSQSTKAVWVKTKLLCLCEVSITGIPFQVLKRCPWP